MHSKLVSVLIAVGVLVASTGCSLLPRRNSSNVPPPPPPAPPVSVVTPPANPAPKLPPISTRIGNLVKVRMTDRPPLKEWSVFNNLLLPRPAEGVKTSGGSVLFINQRLERLVFQIGDGVIASIDEDKVEFGIASVSPGGSYQLNDPGMGPQTDVYVLIIDDNGDCKGYIKQPITWYPGQVQCSIHGGTPVTPGVPGPDPMIPLPKRSIVSAPVLGPISTPAKP